MPTLGKDLKCTRCGAGAKDVAPETMLDEVDWFGRPSRMWAVSWTCDNGHKWISGAREPDKGIEHLQIGD